MATLATLSDAAPGPQGVVPLVRVGQPHLRQEDLWHLCQPPGQFAENLWGNNVAKGCVKGWKVEKVTGQCRV